MTDSQEKLKTEFAQMLEVLLDPTALHRALRVGPIAKMPDPQNPEKSRILKLVCMIDDEAKHINELTREEARKFFDVALRLAGQLENVYHLDWHAVFGPENDTSYP
jgi:hypothetical protein